MEAEVAESVTGLPESSLTTVEQSYHLLEDEEKINHILRSLPTEEYYFLLRVHVAQKFPGARPDVIEHLCELEEFF